MNRTKDELLLECIKQFEHIENVLGFNRLSTTKSLIEEIEQALRTHSVSERTFIVEEKIAGTCSWEALSVEFDNIQQAKHFYNRHFEKYSENIRLIEVYAR